MDSIILNAVGRVSEVLGTLPEALAQMALRRTGFFKEFGENFQEYEIEYFEYVKYVLAKILDRMTMHMGIDLSTAPKRLIMFTSKFKDSSSFIFFVWDVG